MLLVLPCSPSYCSSRGCKYNTLPAGLISVAKLVVFNVPWQWGHLGTAPPFTVPCITLPLRHASSLTVAWGSVLWWKSSDLCKIYYIVMGLEKSFSQFIWMNKLKTDYPFDLNFGLCIFLSSANEVWVGQSVGPSVRLTCERDILRTT